MSALICCKWPLFCFGWGGGRWGGMVTHTGGAQKLHRGEATVFGAGASWPHLWGCSDCDSHPGVGRNPTISGWQTLLGAHWDAEEIWHPHQPSVCPEWRVSEARASPVFPLTGKPDHGWREDSWTCIFTVRKWGPKCVLHSDAIGCCICEHGQFEVISLMNALYLQTVEPLVRSSLLEAWVFVPTWTQSYHKLENTCVSTRYMTTLMCASSPH